MRRLLDFLYDSAAALAALFMVGLLWMVLLSIASRQFHFHVPGTDAYAGYLMSASGFLALAHTLKRGEHIRVTLLLNFLKGGAKKAFEIWALAIATLLAVLFAVLAAVFGMLVLNRLPRLHHPVFDVPGFERVNVDRFFLIIFGDDASFEPAFARSFLESLAPRAVHTVGKAEEPE